MSILDVKLNTSASGKITDAISEYTETDGEKEVSAMILKHFTLGDVTMQKPRREFNDLSTLQRMMTDQMSFNIYQPNNGEPAEGDIVNGWRSNAIRPIVRNKCMSIAAHATAHLIFPKVFAHDEESEEQRDAAQVMRDLMEWAGEQCNYKMTSLYAVIAALVNPAAIVYTEYAEAFREVKREKLESGEYRKEVIPDEILSGFQDTIVPVDELYIENFYEHDIQKQGWLIWRRVKSYSLLKSQYEKTYPNFKYVSPGIQVMYNDANTTFYNVYDSNMYGEMCEEVIYWNRGLDLKIIKVNNVMLTDCDNPNPRIDKLYPFDKFGFELIDEGKCFYYKSLAFKIQPDADVINTLYPMMIDATYLNNFPAMILNGNETIDPDVIVPGAVTTLRDPNSKLQPIQISQNLQAGMGVLQTVEKSVEESADQPRIISGGRVTSYQTQQMNNEQTIMMGNFLAMIGSHVRQYGKLREGDILQHLTIADVTDIVGDTQLVYKTFLLQDKSSGGKSRTRKIKFDSSLPNELSTSSYDEDLLKMSYENLAKEGGPESDKEIYRVNPELFRKLKFMTVVSDDILNPLSEEAEKAYRLEAYDRMIKDQNGIFDQQVVARETLLGAYDFSKRDPDKFFKKDQGNGASPSNPFAAMGAMMQPPGGGQPPQGAPQPGGQQGGQPPAPQNGLAKTQQIAQQPQQSIQNAQPR